MILILGGARSGKSKFALDLAKRQCSKVAYIATGPVCDEEMKARVRIHRKTRPKHWVTIENPGDLTLVLKKIPKDCDGVLIECAATYVSNLMMDNLSDPRIIKNVKTLLGRLEKLNKRVFIVANEVGGGVVPDTALGRRFRDIVGNINQIIARHACEVYLITAGLPVRLK